MKGKPTKPGKPRRAARTGVPRAGPDTPREPFANLSRSPAEAPLTARAFDLPEALPPGALDDRELVGCTLHGGWAVRGENLHPPGTAGWHEARPVARRLRLRETTLAVCNIEGMIFEDCVFDGLRVPKPFFWRGCGFRHVVLRGFIGAMDVNPGDDRHASPQPGPWLEGHLDAAAQRAFYDDVDWALDLREASLSELSITGIPVDKIRRDPELHAVLRRDKADVEAFLALRDVSFTWFPQRASDLARSHEPATLLMANPRAKSFEADRKALAALRRAGLVE